MNGRQRILASTILAVGGLGLTATAHAASAAGDSGAQVTEVIVTAEKREEKLQDAPLAITAYNAQTLKNASVTSLTDLDGKIPNVTLEAGGDLPGRLVVLDPRTWDSATWSRPSSRRSGSRSTASTWRATSARRRTCSTLHPSRCCRGPQGTLDGGNTIGGMVAITHQEADRRAGRRDPVTGGDRGRVEVRAASTRRSSRTCWRRGSRSWT